VIRTKLTAYLAERRIIREDRRRLRRLFTADFQFSRVFDDTWYRRRQMTIAGGRYTPRRTL
jgi:hypothetical protein